MSLLAELQFCEESPGYKHWAPPEPTVQIFTQTPGKKLKF
jgi:hypothetical protein